MGKLYAGDAGIVSRYPDELDRMMAVTVVICQEFRWTVFESKTTSMGLWSTPSSAETSLNVNAAG